MTWTIEKLREVADRIAVVKGLRIYTFNGIEGRHLAVFDKNGHYYRLESYDTYKYYDHDMKLIEPTKEREFEILEWWYYPLSRNIRLNSSSYEGFKEICSNEEANAVKVKGADKFKRYLDTGEIRVMK